MKWRKLRSLADWDTALQSSHQNPIVIFKHSTRCGISMHAISNFEHDWKSQTEIPINPYYLDLLKHSDVSGKIAEDMNITHQSPQAILIKDGKSLYHASHQAIDLDKIIQQLNI